jgi:hypothetical protein
MASTDLGLVAAASIAAIPSTIAALAAWRQASKLRHPVEQINRAVNHRQPGQRRLVEMVDDLTGQMDEIKTTNAAMNKRLENLGRIVRNHQAWHQKQTEGEL